MTIAANPTPLLRVEHLTMRFGGLFAINDLSFAAKQQEITAIIGPNGAGKTTVFNCLTGFYKPSSGRLTLTAPDSDTPHLLERMDGFCITKDAKVARTFQNIRLFSGMSVLENLLVAQHNALMRASVYSLAGLLNLKSYRVKERQSIEKAKYWLEKIGLTAQADWSAGNLPYGSQRRLEIARAMCTDPVLLCLDEPAAGLNPKESLELNDLLLDIRREQRIGILLIEHDMSVVMNISDHIVVLDHGARIADGSPIEIRNDPAVIRAYLGADEDEDLPQEIATDIRHAAQREAR
ncbi:ABC transporter ATP-binding protein [Telmatospirillum siberiense]|uniref:ABC transporter ATP-binding protein n=1 Tax=Telmatospirillum siberiense TaxID=382514 RepID=A0A2N3PPA4_9PROT|nr:ATP-binding cassette domain-containing protein [Telmatospirillum siberiense]PKU22204.1 ABC transporter ATP-binding protein [Telmatospirillum siberiense]